MKTNLLLAICIVTSSLLANGQTKITNNPITVINSGNSVTCNAGGIITGNNSFYNVYDIANYPNIVDTAFFVRVKVGCETTSGGAYNIIGRVHKLVGAPVLANLTLLADDTIAIYPDSSTYLIQIPYNDGYALPNDSLASELLLPANTTASFYPASNTSPESSPTYIVAADCSINDFTTMSSVGFPMMHLIMNLYVNQKPLMATVNATAFKDNDLNFTAADFTNQFTDNDNDGITMMQILALPSNGVLDLTGTSLIVGDTVLTSELASLKYIPNTGYSGNDNFQIRVRDSSHWSNGAANVDITVYNWALAVTELENSDLQIYPNPANDILSLKVDGTISSVRIVDFNGKLVTTSSVLTNTVDVSQLAVGSYFILVETELGRSIQQFVKL